VAGWQLSIDFGTSFTVAAGAGPGPAEPVYFGARREPAMPSGVFAEADGGLLTGTKAANARQLDPERYVATPKRLLGAGLRTVPLAGGPLPVARMVSAVLADAARRAGQQHGGTVPPRTVLTHPASWDTDLQRVLVAAAREAGLAGVRVLAEPVAAALHLGRERRPGEHIAVYDLGGGTFDAAVLRCTAGGFEVAATDGRTSIGGEWFDELLHRHLGAGPLGQVPAWRQLAGPGPGKETAFDAYLAWRNKVELLKENIRFTKEVLSDENSWGLIIPDYPEGWTVTRETLEGVLDEPLQQTADVLAATIAAAGLAPGQLSAIYLVGGASRTPLVRQLLASRFPGKVVSSPGDPQTVVALGAAASWDHATDPDQPATPPPRKTAQKKEEEAPTPPATWHSRLAIVPADAKAPVRLDRYEVSGLPCFGILARRQTDSQDTIGAFIEAQQRNERQEGWTLTPPRAARITGAEVGLTQRESGTDNTDKERTRTRVYAAVSAFLVTAWSSDTDGTRPGTGADSLSIEFRTVGQADQLGLSLTLAVPCPSGVRERLSARVRLSWSGDYGLVTASTGPAPDGVGTPEELAGQFMARHRKINPAARIGAPVPDVFLGSRLCVRQAVTAVRKPQDHWWTGLVDGQFVVIRVEGAARRQAEKCRDVIALRQGLI
jgi:molecular chaperone DnaK